MYYLEIILFFRSHWEMMGMTEIFEQVSAVSENFIQYQLHKNESLLLQATVLVNAGTLMSTHIPGF